MPGLEQLVPLPSPLPPSLPAFQVSSPHPILEAKLEFLWAPLLSPLFPRHWTGLMLALALLATHLPPQPPTPTWTRTKATLGLKPQAAYLYPAPPQPQSSPLGPTYPLRTQSPVCKGKGKGRSYR